MFRIWGAVILVLSGPFDQECLSRLDRIGLLVVDQRSLTGYGILEYTLLICRGPAIPVVDLRRGPVFPSD